MKYTFIMEETDIKGDLVGNKLVSEFNADYLSDILVRFQDFLKGSGFVVDGTLDFVNDEHNEDYDGVEEFETPQEPVHDWSQTLRDDVEWPFAKQESIYDGDLNSPSAGANMPKNTEPWHGVSPSVSMQWTVNELMKGPMTLQDVTKEDNTLNLGNYGAASPTVTVSPGVDTITLTGFSPSCELCGLPKSVMKSHRCYDDNCPKGNW